MNTSKPWRQQRIGDRHHIVAGGTEYAQGAIAGIADDQRNPPLLFQWFAMASPVKLLLCGAKQRENGGPILGIGFAEQRIGSNLRQLLAACRT